MRQLGAAFLAFWYSLILCFSFSAAVKSFSTDISGGPGNHYVIIGLTWLAAVGFAAFLAGVTSRSHPLGVCVFAALPVLAVCVWGFGYDLEDYRLPTLAFGWGPTASGYMRALLYLSIGAAFIGGLIARSELRRNPSDEHRILEVSWGHWWWLWVPISSWAGIIPGALYLLWLTVAAVWHWTFHPSLWFNWRWGLFLTLGTVFTLLPYALLNTGISEAWDILSFGKQRGLGKGSVALRFVAWSYGCAVVGSTLSMLLGFWILSHLPIISGAGKPWWVIF